MRIEVVWVGANGVRSKEFELKSPCTVAAALRLAGLDAEFTHAGLATATVGVFGRIANREEDLRDGDRIEIYRGPAVDAKLARRARANRSRKAGR
jgi:putative ubiquitin-RnfH superfamily antitoxin RatB of RatAB toxin-antitoxin module